MEDSVSKNEEIIQRIRNHIQNKTKEGATTFRRDATRRHTGQVMSNNAGLKDRGNMVASRSPALNISYVSKRPLIASDKKVELLYQEHRKENDSNNIEKKNVRGESLVDLSTIKPSIQKSLKIDTFKDRFQIIRALGKGKCADVFLAQDKLTD